MSNSAEYDAATAAHLNQAAYELSVSGLEYLLVFPNGWVVAKDNKTIGDPGTSEHDIALGEVASNTYAIVSAGLSIHFGNQSKGQTTHWNKATFIAFENQEDRDALKEALSCHEFYGRYRQSGAQFMYDGASDGSHIQSLDLILHAQDTGLIAALRK